MDPDGNTGYHNVLHRVDERVLTVAFWEGKTVDQLYVPYQLACVPCSALFLPQCSSFSFLPSPQDPKLETPTTIFSPWLKNTTEVWGTWRDLWCNKNIPACKAWNPKVYRKPLSSDVCISSGILGAVVQRNQERKRKHTIMIVSGWRLCDYWLTHESLKFWDAEHVSAANWEDSSLASRSWGIPEREREREKEVFVVFREEQGRRLIQFLI